MRSFTIEFAFDAAPPDLDDCTNDFLKWEKERRMIFITKKKQRKQKKRTRRQIRYENETPTRAKDTETGETKSSVQD